MKTKATARVRITVEVSADGSWGGDCTLEQVRKQAMDAAVQRLASVLEREGRGGILILGVERPEVVVTDER